MLFNSYQFIFAFLPITAIGFFLLGRLESRRLAIGWLVLCSMLFYGYWNPAYLLLLCGSVAGNYIVGRGLERQHHAAGRRKLLLTFGVAANLGLLGYFKYANFFVDSANAALGASIELPAIVLPLAISFFTFQQIAYLVDQSRDPDTAYSFLDYCLFVTFFPQLIAGPIVHHKAVLPQFSHPKTFRPSENNVAIGVTIFLMGLFKKVVLADQAAIYANQLFDGVAGVAAPTFAEAWIGTLAYTFQLYFDFSGYSDMAIGLGRMFGIRLPLNFNSPYKATSIVDFWRRWHITLSSFLRDYLYVPLGGNRRGPTRRSFNLIITMLLGGLWHGAGWNYVMWGGLHGLYLCINRGWSSLTGGEHWEAAKGRRLWKLAAGCLTFLAVVVGWVYFRAADFRSAHAVLASMAGLNGLEIRTVFRLSDSANVLILLGVIVWAFPNTQQLMARYRPAYDWERIGPHVEPVPVFFRWMVWRPTVTRAVLMIGSALLIFFNLNRVQEFLYFQF